MALHHEDNKPALSIALKKSRNGAYFSIILMCAFKFYVTSILQLDLIPFLQILNFTIIEMSRGVLD